MHIRRSSRIKALIGIKALSRRPALKSLARRVDFIFLEDGCLNAVICAGHDRPVEGNEVLNLFKKRYVAGLDRLFIVAPGGFTAEAMQVVKSGPGDRLSLVAADPSTVLMRTDSWNVVK